MEPSIEDQSLLEISASEYGHLKAMFENACKAVATLEAERDELKQVLSGYKVHDQLIAERAQFKADLAVAVEALIKTKDLYRAKDDSRLLYVYEALEKIGVER